MDVGIFVLVVPEAAPSEGVGDEYYVGTRLDGAGSVRPYCLAALLVRDRNAERLTGPAWVGRLYGPDGVPVTVANAMTLLGPCAYFHGYGAPGEEIATWLKAGAIVRGAAASVTPNLRATELPGRFGAFKYAELHVSLRGQHCLEGSLAACRAAFLDVGAPEWLMLVRGEPEVPELWHYNPYAALDFRVAEPALFADLEREFGAERFRRFWTSQEDVAAAFQSAFGVAPELWMQTWARSYYGEGRRSLRAGVGDWTVTLLLVLAALAVAIGVTARRQVG